LEIQPSPHFREEWLQSSDWLPRIWKDRQESNYNNLALITGPLGGGKSRAAIKFGEALDPMGFTIDNVVFTPAEFTKRYREVQAKSLIVWDEAELGLGHRNFMTEVNKAVTGFIQSSRYLEVSVIFTLPQMGLMDTAAVRVSHFLIRMFKRGYARVHSIQPNELGRHPPVRTPTIGDVHVAKCSEKMWTAYLAKRDLFHKRFFPVERFQEAENNLIEEGAKKQKWQLIAANPDPFKDPFGKIDARKIQAQFSVSPATAYNWKHIVEGKLNL